MIEIIGKYDEVFKIEMEGWCYGVANYPGEIFPSLIHAVIHEIAPAFKASIEHNYAFSVLALAKQISKAAKYLIHEKEVAFSIITYLPNPRALNEDSKYTLAQIIDEVEQEYGGALERLEKLWAYENKKVSSDQPLVKKAVAA